MEGCLLQRGSMCCDDFCEVICRLSKGGSRLQKWSENSVVVTTEGVFDSEL